MVPSKLIKKQIKFFIKKKQINFLKRKVYKTVLCPISAYPRIVHNKNFLFGNLILDQYKGYNQ